MSPMEQALDALGRGQGAWTKDTAQNLADLIAAKDARIEQLQAVEASLIKIGFETEKNLTAEIRRWNADARRLSGGLLAIYGAAETVPASVLRVIAYDVALNCIEPDVAKYQIERRAALAGKEGP